MAVRCGVIDEFCGQVLQHFISLSARKQDAEQPVWQDREMRSVQVRPQGGGQEQREGVFYNVERQGTSYSASEFQCITLDSGTSRLVAIDLATVEGR
jgi:hypothetical protein